MKTDFMKWFYSMPLVNVDWSAADFGAVLKSILALRFFGNADLLLLESSIKDLLSTNRITAFENGRSALMWILKSAVRLKQNNGKDEVIIPAFCCRAVLEAVIAAGMKPVLCDITENITMDQESVKRLFDPEKTIAIIAPHIYGFPTPISPLLDLVKESGALVIDDAAASLGEKSNGKLLGLSGDAGVFSFSQGKAAVAGGGGILVIPENSPLSSTFIGMPAPMKADMVHGLKTFILFIWRDLFHRVSGPVGRSLNIAFARLGLNIKAGSTAVRIRNRAMPGLQAAVALSQVNRLRTRSDGRRRNMIMLKDELSGLPNLRVISAPEDSVPTRFIVETADLKVKRIKAGVKEENPLAIHLRNHGIEAKYAYLPLHFYGDPPDLRGSHLKQAGLLPERLVLLPFLPPLGPGDIARISKAVRSFYGS